MMKTGASLLNTEETAFALRQALGDISAWHKALEFMRNDAYLFHGLRLLPATRVHDGRSWRPQYDAAHVLQFIVDVRRTCGAAVSGKPVTARRGDYDPDLYWKVQKTEIRACKGGSIH